MSLKQQAISIARQVGVLPKIEVLRYYHSMVKYSGQNRQFRSQQHDYKVPPNWLAYDAYKSVDFSRIYEEAQDQLHVVVAMLKKYAPKGTFNVLDWGCGPARILQYIPKMLSGSVCFGTDYNTNSIAWCKAHVPDVTFSTNGLYPPLDFSDHTFDLIYAISVFTHLSEPNHRAWIAELRRLLKPGGVLLLTLHGNLFRNRLTAPEQRSFDSGELVIRGSVLEGSRLYAAFQPDDYVVSTLLRGFTVLEKVEPFTNRMLQTVWVARR